MRHNNFHRPPIMFKMFFAFVLLMVTLIWAGTFYAIYKVVTIGSEFGVKGLIEQGWCGEDPSCKLPTFLQD